MIIAQNILDKEHRRPRCNLLTNKSTNDDCNLAGQEALGITISPNSHKNGCADENGLAENCWLKQNLGLSGSFLPQESTPVHRAEELL